MKQDSILQKLDHIEQHLTENEKPLTLQQAAEYLGISKSSLYKKTFKREIQFFKPGGKLIYFRKSDLDKWIYRNRKSSDGEIEQKATDYVHLGTAL